MKRSLRYFDNAKKAKVERESGRLKYLSLDDEFPPLYIALSSGFSPLAWLQYLRLGKRLIPHHSSVLYQFVPYGS
jgi:hypothetical protein